ncbi:TetR/AcrR family transcriptional regulator [Devosia sp. FKR38]|uniref:TetR/AcrR family transcriptional regulator n=1 Tax=Devosia sp. FKR38 TaxID=2562312 RepID=UPI0010BF71CB|nr:TetR/AcrR family transcriptional regulator [Devosia sp. FKR38]
MENSHQDNSRRRPKGDKRQRTRAALLAAARELVHENGFDQVTMEAVARRAGMTSGAIYGNFKNRDDLLIALSDQFWAPIMPDIAPGSSFDEILAALADATIAVLPERELAAVGYLRGRAFALGQSELRRRVHEATAQDYAAGAQWLRETVKAGELQVEPELLVRVIHAMSEGLVLQRLLTPDLVPDAVIRAAFAALSGNFKCRSTTT